MKYYSLPNLNWQDVEELSQHPSEIKPTRPSFEDKAQFREWCNAQSTKHYFISPFEGVTPSARVTVDNPALYQHGWVLDYDAVCPEDLVALIPENGAAGLLPMWVHTTFSGKRRLIFEFEEPVMVDNKELAERFLKELGDMLNVRNLLPALDEKSFTTTQYFEIGRDWKPIPEGKPIPSRHLMLAFFKAAGQKIIQGEGPDIPIEKVAEEVERRWPGRVKSFNPGDRVPLFWIDPFQDRVGAQVGQYGMICYSARAGKSFVHWGELLGKEFVRDYMAAKIGDAVKEVYFDSKSYWARLINSNWAANTKEDMGADLGIRYGLKKNEVPEALSMIRNAHRVVGAFPYIHNKALLVQESAGPMLNISSRKLTQPAEQDGGFPWLRDWTSKMFRDTPGQYEAFISWLHHLYRTAYEGKLASGQAAVIAGGVGVGKTLFSQKVIGSALGGFTDAADYLMGRCNFNKEAAETAIWCVDDNRGGSTWEKHDEISNNVKRYVANTAIPYHPKFRDSFMVPWRGRIIITCNTDAKSLSILPEMDNSIVDKMMLFKLSDFQPKFDTPEGIELVIQRELPYFLRWLLTWEIPEAQRDVRFGVKAFLHPELLTASHEASASGQLLEMMSLALKISISNDKKEADRLVTSTEIRQYLDVDGLRTSLQKFAGNRLGIALAQLEASGCGILLPCNLKRNGSRLYRLNLRYNYENSK